MTYEEAIAFLDDRIGHGRRPGLERINGLLDVLADPHRMYPVVQVAGTNGKTSTTLMVGALLAAVGIRPGTFTSPHLIAPEERIMIDGAALTTREFAAAMSDISPLVQLYEAQAGTGVTYFELTTALAFAWFAERAVGAAAVEVGLGGRWDATSAATPAVAVITSIDLDHQEYLGGTLAEIAAEKAAIIPRGGIAVTGRLPTEAHAVVAAVVESQGARWLRIGRDLHLVGDRAASGGRILEIESVYGHYAELPLGVSGAHQAGNFTLALGAVEAFLGREIAADVVAGAAAGLQIPGRLEVVADDPLILLDGAHNAGGSVVLAHALAEEFAAYRWTAVVGFTGPRNPAAILEPLVDHLERIVAVAPQSERAVDPDTVVAAAASLGLQGVVAADAVGAVRRAAAESGPGHGVLVTGSLYLVGEIRHAWSD